MGNSQSDSAFNYNHPGSTFTYQGPTTPHGSPLQAQPSPQLHTSSMPANSNMLSSQEHNVFDPHIPLPRTNYSSMQEHPAPPRPSRLLPPSISTQQQQQLLHPAPFPHQNSSSPPPPLGRLIPPSLTQATHLSLPAPVPGPPKPSCMLFDLTEAGDEPPKPSRRKARALECADQANINSTLLNATWEQETKTEQQPEAQGTKNCLTIDLTHDLGDDGEDESPVEEMNGLQEPALQGSSQSHTTTALKRPLHHQGAAPPSKVPALSVGALPSSVARLLPQQQQQQQQQQLLALRRYLCLQQQRQQQQLQLQPLLSDDYFLNLLNQYDEYQKPFQRGLLQMEALLESGEYAGKPLNAEQMNKATAQREICAQHIQQVQKVRHACLEHYDMYIACGRPRAIISGASARLLPASLSQQPSIQHLTAQQQYSHARSVDHRAALKAVMENLSLTGQDEIDTPQNALVMPIMRHQKMALAWMCKREISSNPPGGILADDQGLGKTVSAIALIVTNTPDPTADRRASHKLAGPRASPPGSQSVSPRSTSPTKPSSPSTAADAVVNGSCGRESSGAGNSFGAAEAPGQVPQQQRLGGSSTGAAQQQQPQGGGGGMVDVEPGVDLRNLHMGGTLVVCPTSVLHQWHREFKDKVNQRAGFSVCVYHGKDKVALPSLLCKYTLVLTTYGTLAMEAPAKPEGKGSSKKQQQSGEADDEAAVKDKVKGGVGSFGAKGSKSPARKSDEGGLLYKIFWHRVILDEAQSIKNARTLAAHAAFCLHASHRWCMSGTPIQNSVDDLFAHFKFLRYKPYNEPSGFKELIKDKIALNPDNGYKILSVVLQAILLRRTKSTKLGDEPIVNLPPREQELIQPEFTRQEAEFYVTVQEDGKRALEETAKKNGGKEQYVNMLYHLLKMRQACSHPWLVKGLGQRYRKGSNSRPATAAELAAARKLAPEMRQRLLSLVQHPQAQCSVCMDVPEDPVVSECGHVYCQQCAAAQLEGAGHEDECLCTSCSSVLHSSSLHSAAALQGQQPQQSKPVPKGGGGKKAGSGAGISCDAPWASSTKVDLLMELLQRLAKGSDSMPSASQAGASMPCQVPGPPSRSKVSSKLAKMFKPLGPPLASQPAGKGGPSPPGGGAGKKGLKGGPRKDKVIVFSQWTSMLDLLEVPMGAARIGFRRLDGTMSVAQRERAIIDFEDQPEIMVLLVSLKAAALGVNLTCANHVVLMDLWWNPTVEEQAIDRAHRIGQTRTVHVTRLAIKGTVEERILELQARKRAVVAAALEEGQGADGANKLTMEDLRYLFLGAPPSQAASPFVPGPSAGGASMGLMPASGGTQGANIGSAMAHTSQASMPVQGGSLVNYTAL